MMNDESSPAILTRESVIKKLSDDNLVTFLAEESAAVNRIMDAARREGGIHALNVGHALIEAKRRFGQPHGQWIPWLKKHLSFDERMAQRYIKLARKGSAIMKQIPNTKHVSHLTIRALETYSQPPNRKKSAQGASITGERAMPTAYHGASKFISFGWDLLERLGPETFNNQVTSELHKLLAEAQRRLNRVRAIDDKDEEQIKPSAETAEMEKRLDVAATLSETEQSKPDSRNGTLKIVKRNDQ
jgi:hypothetical protein